MTAIRIWPASVYSPLNLILLTGEEKPVPVTPTDSRWRPFWNRSGPEPGLTPKARTGW